MNLDMKFFRLYKNYTQADLGEIVGLSHVTISKIERGEIDNVKLGTLKKIADALETSVSILFLNE